MTNEIYKEIGWDELQRLFLSKYNVKFKDGDTFHREGNIYYHLAGYYDMDDIEIIEVLNQLCHFDGKLYVITDQSYLKNQSPFVVESINLYTFVENHFRLFGLSFFDTDTYIFSFEMNKFWLFQHEGVYSIIDL